MGFPRRVALHLLPLIPLLLPALAGAVVVPGGDVSGTWTAANSPYLVEGEITVPIDAVLTIEPGVEVRFQDRYKFVIEGQLLALGTEQDSILFTAEIPATGWHSLRFLYTTSNGQPNSELHYCRVEYGKAYGTCPDCSGGGIYLNGSDALISHCAIVNNNVPSGNATWGGGGIFAEYCSPRIEYCEIAWNSTPGDGGGIYLYWGQPEVVGCDIHDNQGNRGGGIACFQYAQADISDTRVATNHGSEGVYLSGSAVELVNCRIEGNGGHGVSNYLCDPDLIGCLIAGNAGAVRGGGIYNEGSNPSVVNCTIADNTVSSEGGGIYNNFVYIGVILGSKPVLTNTILYGNSAGSAPQIMSSASCWATLSYCDVEDLAGTGIGGTVYLGDGNIDEDPDFEGTGDHPYAHGNETGCRNGGTPDASGLGLPEFDLAGFARIDEERVDMGGYECRGGSPAEDLPAAVNVRIVGAYPNPFNPKTSVLFEAAEDAWARVSVHDANGRHLAILFEGLVAGGGMTLDWDGCDGRGRLQAAGVYLVRVESRGVVAATRLVMLP